MIHTVVEYRLISMHMSSLEYRYRSDEGKILTSWASRVRLWLAWNSGQLEYEEWNINHYIAISAYFSHVYMH
jgi:hypothetical protein